MYFKILQTSCFLLFGYIIYTKKYNNKIHNYNNYNHI